MGQATTLDDLKKMDRGKLSSLLLEERKRRFALMLQKQSGQLKDLSQVRKNRRMIARVLTVLSSLRKEA